MSKVTIKTNCVAWDGSTLQYTISAAFNTLRHEISLKNANADWSTTKITIDPKNGDVTITVAVKSDTQEKGSE